MREDMYKVIVERPRRGKDGYAAAARLRNDHSGPTRLRTRAGYGYHSLNENLTPLRGYLRAQFGRPWDKVFSEICANIDRRSIRGYVVAIKSGMSSIGLTTPRLAGGTMCCLAEVVSAVFLIRGNSSGLYVAAIAIIVLFAFLISGTWLLMIGIYEDRAKR
jgi:hypothetical protein